MAEQRVFSGEFKEGVARRMLKGESVSTLHHGYGYGNRRNVPLIVLSEIRPPADASLTRPLRKKPV